MLIFLLFPFARGRDHADYADRSRNAGGSSTAIFAQKFDQDYRQAVSYVCLSTILSVATLPLVMLVQSNFFLKIPDIKSGVNPTFTPLLCVYQKRSSLDSFLAKNCLMEGLFALLDHALLVKEVLGSAAA